MEERKNLVNITDDWIIHEFMRRVILLLLMIISMGIVAVGCGREKNPDSSEESHRESQQEYPTEILFYPTTYPANHYVTWVFFGIPGISEMSQKRINQILIEKGIDCQIRFASVGYTTGLEYVKVLDNSLKLEPFDIITSNVWAAGEPAQVHFLKTHFVPLNSYLNTETGKKLKEFYTESEWKQVTLDENIYVIPKAGYVAEDKGVDSGVYVSVNNKYMDYFKGYDGTYTSLKAIYEEIGNKNLHIVVSGFSDMIIYGMLGYSTLLHLPVQNDTRSIIDISKSYDLRDLMTELYSDLKSGVLINRSVSSDITGEVLAYIHLCKGLSKEGFQEFLMAPSLYETSYGNRYGIAADSRKKDLAFQVLALCCSNPEILSLLYLGLDVDVIEKRMELLSTGQQSDFVGICIELSDSQAETLMKYSNEFTYLMSSMYIFNSDGELELNSEFKVDNAWNDFVERISPNITIFDDIDKALTNWVREHGY